MGLIDHLSWMWDKQKAKERFIRRKVKTLTNKYVRREDRDDAMSALFNKGTPEAITGLLTRLTYTHTDSIVDEFEKQRTVDMLVNLGQASVEPILQYMDKQTQVSMAMLALDEILGKESAMKEVLRVLTAIDPSNTWMLEKKLQLVNHLEEHYDTQELVEPLLPFLEDLSDDVTFRVLDVLDRHGDDDLRKPMLERALDPETSDRIRARILDVAHERKWHLKHQRADLQKLMPDGYYFDKRNHVKKRR